jgi:hypothetical protein
MLVLVFIAYGEKLFTFFENVDPPVEPFDLKSIVQIKKAIGIVYFETHKDAIDFTRKYQVLINSKPAIKICSIIKETWQLNRDMIYNTNDIMGCGYGPKFIKKYVVDKPYIFMAPYEWFIKHNETEKIGLIILITDQSQAKIMNLGWEAATGKKFNMKTDKPLGCPLENIFTKTNHPWVSKSCKGGLSKTNTFGDSIFIGLTHEEMGQIYYSLKDLD